MTAFGSVPAFIKDEARWAPNLISATPTLEMGIDIGDLSTLLLSSVPRRGQLRATHGSERPRLRRARPPRPIARRPTGRLVAYAQKLAKAKNLALPPGYDRDFHACRRFLDQHS